MFGVMVLLYPALGRPNKYMKSVSPTRCGLVVAGLLAGGASWMSAQTPPNAPAKPSAAVSALPAAQPTGAVSQTEAAPTAPVAVHHVEVTYADGKLAVDATNASLNEVLREVAHKTGMKITGGVADDRVFGTYGPSAPAVVLDALLEGTGSNILLVDDAKAGSELILTPRRGGVTPPNPNAAQANESEDTGAGTYVAPVRPYQPPMANGRGFGPGPDSQIGPPGSDPGDGSGFKTPQQIYEQLQQAMQQQKATAPQ
jgi:hypothetical protein